MTYYKVLNADGTPRHGGRGKWFLPHGNRPGEWMPKINSLVPCKSGYHICKPEQLIEWLGPTIWEVEYQGEIIEQSDKCVVQQARLIRQLENWNDRTARLFACDCADEALRLVKNPDPRSIEAVRVARLYAIGEANQEQLTAAWSAAGDAAWAAARAAAWVAAWDSARYAAWDAAWDAARAAAWDAARYAAWDAAWSAAGAAAWDAAGDAAWAAARAAAWDAARKWQTTRLFEYLNGERK